MLEQATALNAALAALRPVVALLVDAGVNTNEVTRFVRWAFVDEAASRHKRMGRKPSISQIAAATGLSRPEVSQLLSSGLPTSGTVALAPRSSDKIIAAWTSDPDYLEPTGTPKPLAYVEGTPNFSELVRRYAPDIPPRAMLKEMLASKLVVEFSNGTYIPAARHGQSSLSQLDSVAAFGAKMNAFGWTLLQNLRDPVHRNLFEALVRVTDVGEIDEARVTKELARRCRTFAQGVERYLLDQAPSDSAPASDGFEQTIGVIVAVVERRDNDDLTNTPSGNPT
jgi:transcriptional regulator with XRE-family HTH domain